MNQKLKQFLSTYSSGRYKNSKFQELPDGAYLILDEQVRITSRQISMLRARTSSILGQTIDIVKYEDHLHDTISKAITSLVFEATQIRVEGISLELTAKTKAKLSIALACEQRSLKPKIEKSISEIVGAVFRPLNINITELHLTVPSDSQPSEINVIRIILQNSPINIDDIYQRLTTNNAQKASVERPQVAIMVDRLRKKGLVVWQSSGMYAPTQNALYLFSSAKSRNSSDVKRALALAKRKW